MKGLDPQRRGAVPFIEGQRFINAENRERGEIPETDAGMLRLAQLLWTENFFRKMYGLLKDEIVLLSYPRALAKALYLISPFQRKLLRSWEKEAQELAGELEIQATYVSTLKAKCFQRLAFAISDMRAYIMTVKDDRTLPVSLSFTELASAKKAEAEKEKQPQKMTSQPAPSIVTGWQKDFLVEELGIETPVSKEDWERAFGNLLESEQDVVQFCFAERGRFVDFSRKKYGSPPYARSTYQSAKRKLREALCKQ